MKRGFICLTGEEAPDSDIATVNSQLIHEIKFLNMKHLSVTTSRDGVVFKLILDSRFLTATMTFNISF